MCLEYDSTYSQNTVMPSHIMMCTFFFFSSIRPIQRGGQINYREEEKKILDSILGRDVYDNRIRPSGRNGTGQFLLYMTNYQNHEHDTISTVTNVYAVFRFRCCNHHHCEFVYSKFCQNRRCQNGKFIISNWLILYHYFCIVYRPKTKISESRTY